MSDKTGPTTPDESLSTLAAECLAFARHVADAQATPYQIEKYLAAHRAHDLAPRNDIDRALLKLARKGGFSLALVDAWCGFFSRQNVVRAKLLAVLGILECSPPSFRALDAPDPGGRATIVAMGLRGVAAVLTLACATVLLLPAHLKAKKAKGG
jgi:hypothetical protein